MVVENSKIRGITNKQELKPNDTWRDTRTIWQKVSDAFNSSFFCYMVLFTIISFIIIFPLFAELFFAIGLFIFWRISSKKASLPFRLPQSSKLIDYNNRDHKGKPVKADGISFLGNEIESNSELWFNNSDMRTHLLIFGSTGAGKALRKEELIFTPNGLVKNKDLEVGSKIIKHDGEIGKVLAIYDQGLKNLYEVKFSDGRSIKVSPDHLWEVYEYIENISNVKHKKAEVISTISIYNKLEEIKKINQDREFGEPEICLGILPVGDIDFIGKELITEQRINKIVHENIINFIQRKKYNEELESIIPGTLYQRRLFWGQFFDILKQQYQIVRSYINSEVILFYNEDYAKIIQKLLWSLGYSCNLLPVNQLPIMNDDNYVCGLLIEEKVFLKIDEIIITNEIEECQCIKIDDERGLFVVDNYIVTHNTEALISIAYNSLIHGSGFIYVDGKGDASLWGKILAMARSIGREDDLLVLNYMTGGRDVLGPQKTKLSNTLNPLTTGTSGGLTELIVGLMGGGSGNDADMWKGRAISLVSSVMRALVWKRDYEYFLLDVEKLRDYLNLKKIHELTKTETLPEKIRNSLNAYLQSLPGYNESTGIDKQNETVMEQHGYLQMQFTRVLSSLSDDYGHIFQTNLGEIDFNDVVVNRRILCVLLPALEKSTDELSNLGKIVVGCIKSMMSQGLGSSLEGDYVDIISTRPTNSPAPYTCILDEYGYYSVKGAAVMPAQARSLGFSMIFAGQDLPAFKKNGNTEEAGSIISNCNIKIFMKLEDPTDTYDLFVKSVGEASVQKLVSKNKMNSIFDGPYGDADNLSIVKEKRGDLLDLKDQKQGEAHILFKSQIIRARLFYANPRETKRLQLNSFIKVAPPSESDVNTIKSNEDIAINIINNNFNLERILETDEENSIFDQKQLFWKDLNEEFKKHKLNKKDAKKAILASIFQLEHNIDMEEEYSVEELDINTVERISTFSYEDIDPDYEDKLKAIERNFNKNPEKVNSIVKQTIQDMENVAEYPKQGVPIPEETDVFEIKEQIQDFLEKID